MQAAIYGLEGLELTSGERGFFRDADPAAFILFKRNCETRDQLLRLTDSLRDLTGRADLPILIDQEGGRVARMKPPEWPAFPAAERFADLYRAAPSSAIEAARSNARALALMLRSAGVNVNALPLLDVRQEGANDIIGDRALGSEPMQVAALGRAVLEGMASAGVVGIIKHMPGHGRALVDSHKELPVVTASTDELETDLEPFERLASAPMGMTAHVVYTAWDPDQPASMSSIVIRDIIRERIGFDGFLMSDDIGMEALKGDFGSRAAGVVAAGCDAALHCSGDMKK
jgi:beta-N-acetylhexosaminidase